MLLEVWLTVFVCVELYIRVREAVQKSMLLALVSSLSLVLPTASLFLTVMTCACTVFKVCNVIFQPV